MVEIFDQNAGVLFAFFFLHGLCPVRVEQRKNQRADKYEDQARKGKVFDQPERLYLFFCGVVFHKLRLKFRWGDADRVYIVHPKSKTNNKLKLSD